MGRWRYKVLSKEQTGAYVDKYKDFLYVEVDNGCRHIGRHLMLNTEKGQRTLGRLNKSVFKWYPLVKTEDQPPYINIHWFKFKKDE